MFCCGAFPSLAGPRGAQISCLSAKFPPLVSQTCCLHACSQVASLGDRTFCPISQVHSQHTKTTVL